MIDTPAAGKHSGHRGRERSDCMFVLSEYVQRRTGSGSNSASVALSRHIDRGSCVRTAPVRRPTGDIKKDAIAALGGILDQVGDAREAQAAPPPPPAKSIDPQLVTNANAALMVGIPGVTLLLIAPYIVTQLLGIELPL